MVIHVLQKGNQSWEKLSNWLKFPTALSGRVGVVTYFVPRSCPSQPSGHREMRDAVLTGRLEWQQRHLVVMISAVGAPSMAGCGQA